MTAETLLFVVILSVGLCRSPRCQVQKVKRFKKKKGKQKPWQAHGQHNLLQPLLLRLLCLLPVLFCCLGFCLSHTDACLSVTNMTVTFGCYAIYHYRYHYSHQYASIMSFSASQMHVLLVDWCGPLFVATQCQSCVHGTSGCLAAPITSFDNTYTCHERQ